MLRKPSSAPVWETLKPSSNFFLDRFVGQDGGLGINKPSSDELDDFL
jgi:hypothetical protein